MWSRHKHRVWGQDPLHAGRRQRRTAGPAEGKHANRKPALLSFVWPISWADVGGNVRGRQWQEMRWGPPMRCTSTAGPAPDVLPPLPSNSCEPQHGGGSGARNMAQCSGVCVRKGQFDSGHMLSITQSPSCGQVGGGVASRHGYGGAGRALQAAPSLEKQLHAIPSRFELTPCPVNAREAQWRYLCRAGAPLLKLPAAVPKVALWWGAGPVAPQSRRAPSIKARHLNQAATRGGAAVARQTPRLDCRWSGWQVLLAARPLHGCSLNVSA